VDVQLQQRAAEQFPDQTAAEATLTPALITPAEPAFPQVLNIVQMQQQQTVAAAVIVSEQCSKLDGKLALLL